MSSRHASSIVLIRMLVMHYSCIANVACQCPSEPQQCLHDGNQTFSTRNRKGCLQWCRGAPHKYKHSPMPRQEGRTFSGSSQTSGEPAVTYCSSCVRPWTCVAAAFDLLKTLTGFFMFCETRACYW